MGPAHWKAEFIGKEGIDLMPEALPIETVIFLTRTIVRYKHNTYTYNEEQEALALLRLWIRRILKGQNLARLRMFEKDFDSLLLPLMTEMEFLLHQELVARQINYPRFLVVFRELFDRPRMDVERWSLPASFTSLNKKTMLGPESLSR